jgi:hypothetical protein
MLGFQYELQLQRIGIDHILLNGQTGLGRLNGPIYIKIKLGLGSAEWQSLIN